MHGQFQLPIIFDLGAVFIFGITGALAAIRRGYDLVGLFALTFVTALGGALIRDGIFIQQGPPAIMADSQYLLAVLLAGFVGLMFRVQVERFTKLIAWLDALGLGVYGVVGVQKSLQAHLSVEAAILVGTINAVGGGLLRDVLVREEPLVFQAGQFYLLAALAGCALFPLLTLETALSATQAALVSIAVTFVFRILAIQFNWRTSALNKSSNLDPR
jgi:uncharacterized membrane protein YeiH